VISATLISYVVVVEYPVQGFLKLNIKDWFPGGVLDDVFVVNVWYCFHHEFSKFSGEFHDDKGIIVGMEESAREVFGANKSAFVCSSSGEGEVGFCRNRR